MIIQCPGSIHALSGTLRSVGLGKICLVASPGHEIRVAMVVYSGVPLDNNGAVCQPCLFSVLITPLHCFLHTYMQHIIGLYRVIDMQPHVLSALGFQLSTNSAYLGHHASETPRRS